MRNYRLYAAGICAAIALGTAGCTPKATAETNAPAQESTQETTLESTETETTESEENTEENQEKALQPVRVFGPIKSTEDGKLSIDNQSDVSSSGEIILNVSDDTYILDAMSGMPVKMEDISDGDIAYVYIGPAMTMSLPPMTNAVAIFVNLAADAKAPDYVEVKSVKKDEATSKTVLTAADKTEFTLADDCEFTPYLTRNIVTVDDLTEGRRCVVWSDGDNVASKVLIFAQ